MARIELSALNWQLTGWRPFTWRLGKRIENASSLTADIGPLPARVPASVQLLLLESGLLPDWNTGLNSLACEWVEHRHWDFSAWVSPDLLPAGAPVVLDAPGLDYSGWVLVDCVEKARFEGTLVPHRIDLGMSLSDGSPHLLSIIFEEPPREQAQYGYTSLSRYFKPRYNYSWDWCPRIVPAGVWEPAELLTGTDADCVLADLAAALGPDNQTGTVTATVNHAPNGSVSAVSVALCRNGNQVASLATAASDSGNSRIVLAGVPVEPWYPNGSGPQALYEARVCGLDADGLEVWAASRTVGFKHVEWRQCEGAPAGAEPWICVVNGAPVFLQGVNWVPPKAVYHDATREDYARLIRLYRDMGVNVLRVWGGGILEKQEFYDLCDENGILVWQELPLSSSGIENCPPDAPEAIALLEKITEAYIRRRGHHASLLLWSGGNELTWGGPGEKTGIVPLDYSHPCIAALKNLIKRRDPSHRFIATSPTGPRFYAEAKEYGQGLHHDIHGPWGLGNFEGATFAERLDAWRTYWEQDDALFRSEVGMPGAATAACLERFAEPGLLWPPEGRYWMHTAAWWTQWDLYKSGTGLKGNAAADLAAYVEETQAWQAEAYAVAAKTCKDRFPRCGGFIIWMGHDCFPCPANNSVIDFLCAPKPAYYALQRVFKGV